MSTLTGRDIYALIAHEPQSSSDLAQRFGVTRQAIHYHLKGLESQGLVRQIGKARATTWEAVHDVVLRWKLGAEPWDEDRMWREFLDAYPLELNEATRACLNYAATEMLNNAIDHSGGTEVSLRGRHLDQRVELIVTDDGIGAFRHVAESFGLESELDAIAHIAKGKQTTDPARHSGQGIFFTSKLVDRFELDSGAHTWIVDNLDDDQTVARGAGHQGTSVRLITGLDGLRNPKDVFDKYTNLETYEMDRTSVKVALSALPDDLISRSEAKRLATGLELYRRVVLDFDKVNSVGQGFVDELFRVWASHHPDTDLEFINASPEVDFMIRRGLAR